MHLLVKKFEKSVSGVNCNPLLYLVALVVIFGAVTYHFRSAIIHAVVMTLAGVSIIFLAFAVVHIARHIIHWRHNHQPAIAEDVVQEKVDDKVGDPVTQAQDVISAALEGLVIPPTQNASKDVE